MPGSLIEGYVVPEEEEENRVKTDLWSDPHDGFISEMLLLPTSELLQLFFLSTLLSVIGSVLGQSNRGSPSLSLSRSLNLSPSLSSLYFTRPALFSFSWNSNWSSWLPASTQAVNTPSCPAQHTCSNTRNPRAENLPSVQGAWDWTAEEIWNNPKKKMSILDFLQQKVVVWRS